MIGQKEVSQDRAFSLRSVDMCRPLLKVFEEMEREVEWEC
jgi:hypothetical protein